MNLQDRAEERLGARWPLVLEMGALGAKQGAHVCLVGGIPRDLLLGTSIGGDIDLVVEGEAIELAEAWSALHGGKVLCHRPFQNATWTNDEGSIDLVRARKEHYSGPAQLPQVEAASLDEDLHRRDFRINAMAISVHPDRIGELIDPTGGLEDVRERRLQVLHEKSFVDDPTRAFRGARYATRLRLEWSDESLLALDFALATGALEALGVERLGQEIQHLFEEEHLSQTIECAVGLGILDTLPLDTIGLATSAEELRFCAQTWAGEPLEPTDLLWLLLASRLEKPEAWQRLPPGGGESAKRLAQGIRPIHEALEALTSAENRADQAAAISPLDATQRAYAVFLRSDEAFSWWEQEGRLIKSSVSSQMLLDAGLQPGPEFGAALRRGLEAAWRGLAHEDQLKAAVSGFAP